MNEVVRSAWAIDTRSKEGHCLIGIWFVNHIANPLQHQEGLKIALWETRKKAREFLAIDRMKVYRSFPRMKVVKVKVTIEY